MYNLETSWEQYKIFHARRYSVFSRLATRLRIKKKLLVHGLIL